MSYDFRFSIHKNIWTNFRSTHLLLGDYSFFFQAKLELKVLHSHQNKKQFKERPINKI